MRLRTAVVYVLLPLLARAQVTAVKVVDPVQPAKAVGTTDQNGVTGQGSFTHGDMGGMNHGDMGGFGGPMMDGQNGQGQIVVPDPAVTAVPETQNN